MGSLNAHAVVTKKRMDHDDVAAVVLVRAVEELLPDRIPPENLLDAHIAAGDPAEGSFLGPDPKRPPGTPALVPERKTSGNKL